MLNTEKEWKLIPDQSSPSAGVTISKMYFDKNNHLICELSDGSIVDAGVIPSMDITIINGGNANTFA